MLQKIIMAAAPAALALSLAGPATAENFSYVGNFTSDDDVALFSFTINAASSVTLKSLSYAGGVNAAGQTIARGGFDPILALYDSAGTFIADNDDGGTFVPADTNGIRFDVFLQQALNPGTYTVAVTQYNNRARSTLAAGFSREGQGNFTSAFSCSSEQTSFRDVSGSSSCGRDGHWAFDILNVASASGPPQDPTGPATPAPEPATWAMMIVGFGLAGTALRRRRPSTATLAA